MTEHETISTRNGDLWVSRYPHHSGSLMFDFRWPSNNGDWSAVRVVMLNDDDPVVMIPKNMGLLKSTIDSAVQYAQRNV